ncbi:MAG: hypothetical protein AAF657_04275 [Acidobacteriota bacterium]
MNIYLPEPIYTRLPKIYISLAVLLALTPLGTVKWLAVTGLLAAVFFVTRWRKNARDEEQARTAAAIMEKYRHQRRPSVNTDPPNTYVI